MLPPQQSEDNFREVTCLCNVEDILVQKGKQSIQKMEILTLKKEILKEIILLAQDLAR